MCNDSPPLNSTPFSGSNELQKEPLSNEMTVLMPVDSTMFAMYVPAYWTRNDVVSIPHVSIH